jgi:hypothetical protein
MKTINQIAMFAFTLLGAMALLTGIIQLRWSLIAIAVIMFFMSYLAYDEAKRETR